jgi:predicted tellurium resistance membrane protein TerC
MGASHGDGIRAGDPMGFNITMFGTGLSTDFLTALASIVLIDLMLSGDNAVIIAMAVKNLPKQNRSWAIFLGTTGAIAVRVFCTFIISTLLMIQFFKLVFVQHLIHPSKGAVYSFVGLSTVAVLAAGKVLPTVLSKEGKY